MIRRLSRYLLVSASALVAAVAMLPTGCMVLHTRECARDSNPCADEHTEQVCLIGEGNSTLRERPCPLGGRCMEDELGAGKCVAALEGESCVSRLDCEDSPLCFEGRCSKVPPAVVSACSAAPVLHVPTPEDGPDGVTLVTSFEPVELVVSPGLEGVDPSGGFDGVSLCPPALPGSERVLTLELPTIWNDDHPEGVDLVVTIEGLDPTAVSAANMLAYSTCGDPQTLVWGECDHSPNEAVVRFRYKHFEPRLWSLVLQASEPLTKPVPFTVRAQLVAADPQ